MTTIRNPATFPANLATVLAIAEFSQSFPLTQELLMDSIFDRLQEFRATCESIAACKSKVSHTNEQMLEILRRDHGEVEGGYRWNAEKIGALVEATTQVSGCSCTRTVHC